MSMTTTRVTVPVEPTEAMMKAAEKALPNGFMYHLPRGWPGLTGIWSAMLSAAPAPEGGAVPDDVRRLVIAARNVAFDTPTQSELRALEAGENYFSAGLAWEDKHIGRWVADVEEDGRAKAVLAAQAIGEDEDQAVARRELILSALRAQPPAHSGEGE